MRLWWTETQDEDFLFVFHGVMASVQVWWQSKNFGVGVVQGW